MKIETSYHESDCLDLAYKLGKFHMDYDVLRKIIIIVIYGITLQAQVIVFIRVL